MSLPEATTDGTALSACAEGVAVASVMSTRLLTVTEDESLASAYELLLDAGVHHLPVVDLAGRPVGLLDAQTLAETWPATARDDRRATVADVLPRRRPDCVLAQASLRAAAVDMYLGRADAVCIVNEAGVLVGLLTARDIVAVVAGRPVDGASA